MEQYSPDLKNSVLKIVDERDRREEFKLQMQELNNDYEDMLRAKEETKKQLESKFQDVSRKISSTKTYINTERKRVNDMLTAFQSKFGFMITDLKETFDNRLETERNLRKKAQEQNTKRLSDLYAALQTEKEERSTYLEATLRPLRERTERLNLFYNREKVARIERERMILEKLDDAVFTLTERLDEESTQRTMQCGALSDQVSRDMKTQSKSLENGQQKAYDILRDLKKGTQEELASRLSQQDQLMDNISNFVRTFQDTLHVLTGDS